MNIKVFVAIIIVALTVELLIYRQQLHLMKAARADVFIVNRHEGLAIEAARKKNLDELLDDRNNAASYYILGHVALKSHGSKADQTKCAYEFFSQSASLGFSPAMYQMWRMFIDGVKPMPRFLALVYLNLAATEHPELDSLYSGFRSVTRRRSGTRIVQEIERIAQYKRNLIAQNKSLLENARNNEHLQLRIITDEDAACDDTYWNKLRRRK